MNTKPKSNSTITAAVDAAGNPTFTVAGIGTITLDLSMVHADNRAYAEIHGWGQRIPDAAAKRRDTATGESASPQSKFDAMKRVADHYMSGSADWSMVREGVGDTSLTIRALAEATGKTPAETRATVEATAAAQSVTVERVLAAARTSQAVRDAMDRIRNAEPSTANAAALLNALGIPQT